MAIKVLAAQSKQHADLIRHRELNALRRLMTLRQPLTQPYPTTTGRPSLVQERAHQASAQIDALEAQMAEQMGGRASSSFAASSQNLSTFSDAESSKTTSVITEAALQFANNQISTAQDLLQRAIRDPSTHSHIPTWLTLFDLYRATHQVAAFESLSLDFSIRFGRSTPSWVAIGQLTAPQHQLEQNNRADAASDSLPLDWQAPAQMTPASLQSLALAIDAAQHAQRVLILDWRTLRDIAPEYDTSLAHVLTHLANTPLRCTAYGMPIVMHLLQNTHRQAAALAYLALLRCLDKANAFEDAALTYCEDFEISPPDWLPPQCQMQSAEDLAAPPLSPPLAPPCLPTHAAPPLVPVLALVGHADGDLPPVFAAYLQTPTHPLACTVFCDQLVRCTPSLTQKLLAWIQSAKALGISIEFTDLHRLIAAYFLSQGIYEHAKVNLLKN